ncbi:MAG TPA: OmpA family protein [Bacteroidia bacterium]|nr:OmpA family protein [Bacteroidia bacterium]
MKKLMVLAIIIWLDSTCVFAKFSETKAFAHFQSGDDKLSDKEKLKLKDFISTTNSTMAYLEFVITGFADADGSTEYNRALSERRAIEVRNYFIANGIDDKIINYKYHGEQQPISTNADENGKSKNRRVEIALRKYEFEKATEIIKELNGDVQQTFEIDNTKKAEVKTSSGTKFIFPENSFCFSDNRNKIASKVTITITEVRTVSDAMFNNVLAQSDEGMLVSGGMYNIQAVSNKLPLQMVPGKNYTVQLANQTIEQGMKVYTSVPLPNGLVSWKNSNADFIAKSKALSSQLFISLDENIVYKWQPIEGAVDVPVYTTQILPTRVAALATNTRPRKPSQFNHIFGGYTKWYKKLFTSKKRQFAREQKLYSRQMKNYEKSYGRYMDKLVKFEDDSLRNISIANSLEKAISNYDSTLTFQYNLYMNCKLALQKNKLHQMFYVAKQQLLFNSKSNRLTNNPLTAMRTMLSEYIYPKRADMSLENYVGYEKELILRMTESGLPTSMRFYNAETQSYKTQLELYYENNFEAVAPKEYFKDITLALREKQIAANTLSTNDFRTYYQSEMSTLGWINCDRFEQNKQRPMVSLNVNDLNLKDENVMLIVNKYKSNMAMNRNEKGYSIKLPKGENVTLLVIGMDKNNQPMFYKKTFNVNNNTVVPIDLQKISLALLATELKNL